MAVNPGSPQDILAQTMSDVGISRDAAIYLSLRTFEAALRAKTDEESALKQELVRLFHEDVRSRRPEIEEISAAGYRKKLPGWVKINDEAVAGEQDPVTAISIHAKLGMTSSRRIVRIVKMHKDGMSIEEITKAMLDESSEKGFGEIWAEVLENNI